MQPILRVELVEWLVHFEFKSLRPGIAAAGVVAFGLGLGCLGESCAIPLVLLPVCFLAITRTVTYRFAFAALLERVYFGSALIAVEAVVGGGQVGHGFDGR